MPETNYLTDYDESLQSLIRRIVSERIEALDLEAKGQTKQPMTANQLRASELLLKALIGKVLPDRRSLELGISSPGQIWQALLRAESNGTLESVLPANTPSIQGPMGDVSVSGAIAGEGKTKGFAG